MAELIAVIVFVDMLFFSLSLYYLFKDKKDRKQKALLTRLSVPDGHSDAGLLKAGHQRTALSRFAGTFINLSALEALLAATDTGLSVERFFSISLGLGLLFMLPAMPLLRNPFAAFPLMAAGLCLPYVYLLLSRKRREQALVQQLPDTLEMIVRALRAGQSVDGALKEIAASSAPPVGAEIHVVYEEMAMGLSFEQALNNFEMRFSGLPDVKILCTAFIVQRETGGNLTKILAGLADTIRHRFQLKRQVRVLTAEGRTSAMILGLLPVFFALVTWLFNPGYINLLISHPMGRKLLLLAVVFVICGFTVMRLMTRIEV
jgi:tight adherence protein B